MTSMRRTIPLSERPKFIELITEQVEATSKEFSQLAVLLRKHYDIEHRISDAWTRYENHYARLLEFIDAETPLRYIQATNNVAKSNPPTHEQHLAIGETMARVEYEVYKLITILRWCYPKSSRIGKKASALNPFDNHKSGFPSFKSRLDDCYHSNTTNEQFEKSGHIYYNMNPDMKLNYRWWESD